MQNSQHHENINDDDNAVTMEFCDLGKIPYAQAKL